jgi:hypothetical protein
VRLRLIFVADSTTERTGLRLSLIRKIYYQKQFWHSDSSVIFVSTVLLVKLKNSADHVSQLENVWSSHHRIFVLNKNALSVLYRLSTTVYCPLHYCHDKELSRWHLKSHRFPWCATTHLMTKLCNWSAYHTDKDKGRNESANPDTVRQLFERRIRLCTVSSSTRRCCRTSTLVLYYESIRKLG